MVAMNESTANSSPSQSNSPVNPTLAPTPPMLHAFLAEIEPNQAPRRPRPTLGDFYWKCGQCPAEPWLVALYAQCLDCGHIRCEDDCITIFQPRVWSGEACKGPVIIK